MTSHLRVRSRDPNIFDKSRRSVLKTCAKARANQVTCVASFLATKQQFTPSFSPRPGHPPKRSTALHAINHFTGIAQQPKSIATKLNEGFQLITRLLPLLSLQQLSSRGVCVASFTCRLTNRVGVRHPRPALVLHMSGEVHNKYSSYSLPIVLRAGIEVHVRFVGTC